MKTSPSSTELSEKELVCHISFNHSAFDDRIYWKELLSLKEAGYDCIHIAVADKAQDFVSEHGIRIITITRKRFLKNVFLNKVAQTVFKRSGTISTIFQVAANVKASVYHYHDLQVNIIARDLKNLPHRPWVIYDAHEAYHLLMLEKLPALKLFTLPYKFYVHLVKRWELRHAAFCDSIIVTDDYTLQYFKKRLPQIKCEIIFNYSYFLPEEGVADKEKSYHLIYTGHISRGRGIREAIEVVSLLKQKINDVKFLLLGSFEDQDYQTEIMSLIDRMDLNENVIFKSFVPFRKIPDFYSQALIGIGLFHKTPKYSTFIPIKLFEYMAFGLPMVFSNHGPAAEIVKKENCGVLVEYKKSTEVADTIYRLLTDKPYFDMLSENGKNAVLKTYNWRKEKDKLLQLYRTHG